MHKVAPAAAGDDVLPVKKNIEPKVKRDGEDEARRPKNQPSLRIGALDFPPRPVAGG